MDTKRLAVERYANTDDVIADEELQARAAADEPEQEANGAVGEGHLPEQLASGGERREGSIELDVGADDAVDGGFESIVKAMSRPDGKTELIARRRGRDYEDMRLNTVRAGESIEISWIAVEKLMLEGWTPDNPHLLLLCDEAAVRTAIVGLSRIDCKCYLM